MSSKKILVIMPIHNVEKYLEGAIESVIQQTYQNFELVLVDDYSTDNSYKIAKSYDNLDNVTVLKNNENKGCYYTRNRGLELFKDKEWDYFTIHDGDDVSDVTRFEKLIKFFKDNPKLLGCKTTTARVHYSTGEVAHENGRPRIKPTEGQAFYSREAFNIFGYFDNAKFSGDTDYIWRLKSYIQLNPDKYVYKDHMEVLYILHIRDEEENLTVKYPVHGLERQQYFQKIKDDIRTKMIPNNNFYRDIF